MRLINYNGRIFAAESPIFTLNRAMLYGDGLFEGIRIHNGEILFFGDHIDRLFRAMKALKLEAPDIFSDSFFHKEILELGRSQQMPGNARVRIGVFRNGGGLYFPETNSADFFIELIPMKKGFEWSESSCEVSVFRDIQKNASSISFFKSINSSPYVMAAIFQKEKNLGDCFLLNSNGNIADAISSNVFWIENGKIFSPPTGDGGVDGVMRKNLIPLFQRSQFPFEEKSVTPEELKSADEVFLTNIGWGIKPVTHFDGKDFSTKITREIFESLLTYLSSGG